MAAPDATRSTRDAEHTGFEPYASAALDALWPRTDAALPVDTLAAVAAFAAGGDATGRLPERSLAALRRVRYFSAPVPPEIPGGGGASLLECCALQRRLGEADAGLAIALNMHLFSVGAAVWHWRRTRGASGLLLEAVSARQAIVASAFAEPGLGGSLSRSTCVARRVEGGFLVTGVKAPCSLVGRSDVICFQAQREEPGPEALLVAVVPSGSPGLRVERTWDALGMRASESDTLHLEGCFVPDETVFHRCEPGVTDDEVLAAGLAWFCLTTTATYLGVVRAALASGAGACRLARILAPGPEGRRGATAAEPPPSGHAAQTREPAGAA